MTKRASDVFDDLEKYIYQPQPTPYDNLINMGFRYEYEEKGDDLAEKWHIFTNKERRITINAIKDYNGIGWYINFYDPFNYVADIKLAHAVTKYLDWLKKQYEKEEEVK